MNRPSWSTVWPHYPRSDSSATPVDPSLSGYKRKGTGLPLDRDKGRRKYRKGNQVSFDLLRGHLPASN